MNKIVRASWKDGNVFPLFLFVENWWCGNFQSKYIFFCDYLLLFFNYIDLFVMYLRLTGRGTFFGVHRIFSIIDILSFLLRAERSQCCRTFRCKQTIVLITGARILIIVGKYGIILMCRAGFSSFIQIKKYITLKINKEKSV